METYLFMYRTELTVMSGNGRDFLSQPGESGFKTWLGAYLTHYTSC